MLAIDKAWAYYLIRSHDLAAFLVYQRFFQTAVPQHRNINREIHHVHKKANHKKAIPIIHPVQLDGLWLQQLTIGR
ncbi:MAG: hypothetical protein PHT85_15465 [Methylovulum sp.]|nr:hypothetical protein [Methylovulum sp.]